MNNYEKLIQDRLKATTKPNARLISWPCNVLGKEFKDENGLTAFQRHLMEEFKKRKIK